MWMISQQQDQRKSSDGTKDSILKTGILLFNHMSMLHKGSVCLSVCLCLLRLHYAPLQWYMGYLCTIRAQYAPPRRNVHHGAQERLYFLKADEKVDDSIKFRAYVSIYQ